MAAVTLEDVRSALVQRLEATECEVEDTSGGCGSSFDVLLLVSQQFEGKKLLERHRLVNTALAEEMKTIHALSIKKVLTPEQYAASK
mmetsp:Transcript_37660/g.45435  ORF Transcript_37660/g.45435 Transcript_37660/m.45435 type:complete len:87 (-) Transcript_37660:467-727(-)|eukprot:CAMPEP_0197863000 /NCGR_PEP_ID=MMETSP1438-20131217/40152_1 /TAXON_ID=1461541 /ORGANISM="Pterosperma sp., Strain CCMP1384" /LENGTH=86 /DNA_ID=CAMNT_0043480737 /DNA_START=130 /DNA_END=390 /DNA_ORIENTATION=+